MRTAIRSAAARIGRRPRPAPARPGRSRPIRLGAYGAIAAMSVLAPQCAPQCAPPPAPAPATTLQQVVDLTNQRRAEHGLASLTVHAQLKAAAQAHSADQAARDRMSHTGSDGSGPGERIARTGYRASAWAENVAAGYADAASVMAGWMGSAGHRANILSRDVTQIGVGLARAADGTTYWTMLLARPG